MKNKINKPQKTYEILKLNVLITVLVTIANILAFCLIKNGKVLFTIANIYTSGFLFFLYLFLFILRLEKNRLKFKKEILYINYPLHIMLLMGMIVLILIASSIFLICINQDAANFTFIFTFYLSTLSMLLPSILLITFAYLIMPAFIIPGISLKEHSNNGQKHLLLALFILFLVICIFNTTKTVTGHNNFSKQDKFKSSKLAIGYATDYLKLEEISRYAKKIMSKDEIKLPFYYTSDSFAFEKYEEAERFCRALNARVPNYLEIYNIVFNKFDTFGEQYYWTSDKDGKTPLVLQFKNMSYNIIKKTDKIRQPMLYCVESTKTNDKYEVKSYFYRNIQKENVETIDAYLDKPFDFNSLNEYINTDKGNINIQNSTIQQNGESFNDINREKKHVTFNVKEVSTDTFQELLSKGYNYNRNTKINSEYEVNDKAFSERIRTNSNKIRLCYFPFTKYGDLSISQEKEIWEQSFCSPAFDLVDIHPQLKTKNEKNSFCYANGGRLPNIPELVGIIKTLGINQPNIKYWINNNITNEITNEKMPVLVYFQDERFLKVQALTSQESEKAYAICIKNPEQKSIVISNYKSRFYNTDGKYYAKQKCNNCHYYELPDTVLMQ